LNTRKSTQLKKEIVADTGAFHLNRLVHETYDVAFYKDIDFKVLETSARLSLTPQGRDHYLIRTINTVALDLTYQAKQISNRSRVQRFIRPPVRPNAVEGGRAKAPIATAWVQRLRIHQKPESVRTMA